MKKPFYKFFVLAFIVGCAACGKDEPANAGAAITAADTKTPATTADAVNAPVEADLSSQKADESGAVVPERVAEVDEGNDTTEEPAPKGTMPVLKLAQLPPRAPANAKFKEGVNYQRLAPTQPVDVPPDQVQIAEMFWYGCPHCNAIDPLLEEWRKSTQPNGKPPYVVFTRIPATWNDTTRFHARFYFAAQSLGKLEELHPLIFREIHVNGNQLNTLDKAREFFAAHGVDATEFQKNFGAMSLERKIDNATLWAQRYRVSSVPTFVVNGKYVTDVGIAGGEEQLFQLLNELAAREHVKE